MNIDERQAIGEYNWLNSLESDAEPLSLDSIVNLGAMVDSILGSWSGLDRKFHKGFAQVAV